MQQPLEPVCEAIDQRSVQMKATMEQMCQPEAPREARDLPRGLPVLGLTSRPGPIDELAERGKEFLDGPARHRARVELGEDQLPFALAEGLEITGKIDRIDRSADGLVLYPWGDAPPSSRVRLPLERTSIRPAASPLRANSTSASPQTRAAAAPAG